MSEYTFNYLIGRVVLKAIIAPESLIRDNNLDSFYQNPNDEGWGKEMCRMLYHESIHFWQIFSSGYVANLVAEEWNRMVTFEKEEKIISQSEQVQAFGRKLEEAPFSAYELVECWARYWDVHTRSPAQIIKDENIDLEKGAVIERVRSDIGISEYSGLAFDTVMQEGSDCRLYAAPYRWMLNYTQQALFKVKKRAQKDEAAMASYFVALIFPIAAHAAFGCPDPVNVFCDVFRRTIDTDQIRSDLEKYKTGNINFDWLNQWSYILGEAVQPILKIRNMPDFTSGIDVIDRGTLSNHPIYSDYLANISPLRGHIKMIRNTLNSQADAPPELWPVADLAVRTFYSMFGLPGQSDYRYLLGRHFPPPAVQFKNQTIYAERPALLKLRDLSGESDGHDTFEPSIVSLEKRVHRFRAAEYAVSKGLPPDEFET